MVSQGEVEQGAVGLGNLRSDVRVEQDMAVFEVLPVRAGL